MIGRGTFYKGLHESNGRVSELFTHANDFIGGLFNVYSVTYSRVPTYGYHSLTSFNHIYVVMFFPPCGEFRVRHCSTSSVSYEL